MKFFGGEPLLNFPLIEKLVERLSPWYVRNAKPIALAVSVIGCASGVLKALIPLLRPQG